MTAHHTTDVPCNLCEDKLQEAHPQLVKWFHDMKVLHPDLHVSWSFRDQASQEQAVADGKSKLHFPNSAHNKTPAMALDVFQIINGVATWSPWFLSILSQTGASYGLLWGGTFRSLGDNDHFELTI